MKFRAVVTDEVAKKSSGVGYDDLESPQVEADTVLEVRHVSVENRSSGYTRLVIGVADALSFLQKEEEDNPTANDIFWTRSTFLIPFGKRLRARLTGCSSGDKIHMSYEGYLWEVD